MSKKPPEDAPEEAEAHDHDHDHDGDEGEFDDDDVVVLVDEEGVETAYLFIGTVDVEGSTFALLADAEEEEESENTDVYVFHYNQDEEGGESFEPVEDDELLAKVQAAAEKMFEEAEEGE